MNEGSEIRLDLDSGRSAQAYLARPEDGGPGVLLLHAWWGLKPFFKQVCDMLAESGFTALAPDLYQGRKAATIEQAKELLAARDFEFMQEAVKAATGKLAALTGGKLGVVGFSMGASWALVAAANEPEIAAVVLFYGSEGVDLGQVKAKVLGHSAEADEWEPLEGVRELDRDMKAAGLETSFHIYPGAQHWFVEEDRPEYDPGAAKVAWERTIEFLRQNL